MPLSAGVSTPNTVYTGKAGGNASKNPMTIVIGVVVVLVAMVAVSLVVRGGGDPKIDELFVQAMDIWLAELPIIPITQAKKLIPLDTTYWTGWPTQENPYDSPWTWWQSTHTLIHSIKPAGTAGGTR